MNLVEFLKKHKAYRKYRRNVKERVGSTARVNEVILGLQSHPDAFWKAFIWSETKEGFDYWDNLCEKWEDLFDSEDEVE